MARQDARESVVGGPKKGPLWKFRSKYAKISPHWGCEINSIGTGAARLFSVDPAEEVNGHTVLVCRGWLLGNVTENFKLQVKKVLAEGKPVILDLSEVKQMDSSGLGSLVSLWVSSKSSNCPLRFYNLSEPVKRLLGVTHVLKAFEACGSHLTKLP